MHLAGGPGLAGAFDRHIFTEQLNHWNTHDPRGLAHKLD
jgi:hypothetical protein